MIPRSRGCFGSPIARAVLARGAVFSLAILIGASWREAGAEERSLGGIPLLVVPAPNVALARAEDARELRDAPPRFALPVPVARDLAMSAGWEAAAPGRVRQRLRVVATGATSLNLAFGRFHLPPGATMVIEDTHTGRALRPFTANDNASHGELWTPVQETDAVDLTIEAPAALKGEVEVHLTQVGVGYRSLFAALGEKSGSCNIDVVCPQGATRAREVRSVAAYSIGGSRVCTGAMLNSTAGDFRPLFLTAAHCNVTAANAASVVTYWNYQNHSCRPVGGSASGSRGDGSLSQFETGAFFRASSAASDFTLLELDAPPNPAFGIRWAGWSHAAAAPTCTGATPCSVVHHPAGQEKRLSLSEASPTVTSYQGLSSPGDGTHLLVDWSAGVTEPGSSGSPLFDPEGRIVGQLHGGPSYCGAPIGDLRDYFGALAVSWSGADAASRLSDWLDPAATGQEALDGAEPSQLFHPVAPCRLLDTREPDGVSGGPPLASGVPRLLRAHEACGIPTTARTIAANLTVTGATGVGHLAAFAAATVPPGTSVLGIPARGTRASNALLTLGADGALALVATIPAGEVHVVVDVSGYFE